MELFANNAHGTLSAPIDAGDTSLDLVTGQGALFPSPGVGDFFRISLERLDGSATEIVFCTARSGDTLTIARGQEGTTPEDFDTEDRVRLRPTAGMFEDLGGVLEEDETFVYNAWYGPEGAVAANVGAYGTAGPTGTANGTITLATTNHLTSVSRLTVTAALATTTVGFRYSNTNRVWRGDAAGRGGFDSLWEWGVETEFASTRKFIGMYSNNSNFITEDGEPSTRTTQSMVGIGHDSAALVGDNYRFIYHNGTGSTPAYIDTGIPRSAGSVFSLRVWCSPNEADVHVLLMNLTNGTSFESMTSNASPLVTGPPDGATFMGQQICLEGAIGATISLLGCWRRRVV